MINSSHLEWTEFRNDSQFIFFYITCVSFLTGFVWQFDRLSERCEIRATGRKIASWWHWQITFRLLITADRIITGVWYLLWRYAAHYFVSSHLLSLNIKQQFIQVNILLDFKLSSLSLKSWKQLSYKEFLVSRMPRILLSERSFHSPLMRYFYVLFLDKKW